MGWGRWAQPQGLLLSPSEGWPANSQVSGSELTLLSLKQFRWGNLGADSHPARLGPLSALLTELAKVSPFSLLSSYTGCSTRFLK